MRISIYSRGQLVMINLKLPHALTCGIPTGTWPGPCPAGPKDRQFPEKHLFGQANISMKNFQFGLFGVKDKYNIFLRNHLLGHSIYDVNCPF